MESGRAGKGYVAAERNRPAAAPSSFLLFFPFHKVENTREGQITPPDRTNKLFFFFFPPPP